MEDLKNMDLYGLLEVLQEANTQEIKKAYRKKALSCHPDKNPDNPKAAELFHELTRALEILIDESARAAYDKVINAKKAAALRNQALDSKRKKLKEDLEARERQAQEEATGYRVKTQTEEEKLKAEIERLRKEGSKQLEEEVEYVRQQILKEKNEPKLVTEDEYSSASYRLKVKWNSSKTDETNGGYNADNLNTIFSKYGDITGLVVSQKKKGNALLEFKTSKSAIKAFQLEKGYPANPLTLEWLSGTPPAMARLNEGFSFINNRTPTSNIPRATSLFPAMKQNIGAKPNLFPGYPSAPKVFSTTQQTQAEEDYELEVLKSLRRAEEEKRILDQDKQET